MYIQDLVLEVTRRCNMACEHCLRGDAQNLDMPSKMVDEVLKYCESIGTVVFTGGEPSLNIPLIRYFFEQAEKKGKLPGSFYVVTNGKENQYELAAELLKWYPKMEEKELCGVSLSIDTYHEPQNVYSNEMEYVRALSFYNTDKETPTSERYPERYIIPEGRAANWGEGKRKLNESITFEDDRIEMLYVSANGNLIGDCDFSYDHIDQLSEYDIWHLPELFVKLKKEEEQFLESA